MKRKAKELQRARQDAERAGKKSPGFGGFGSSGMSSIMSATIITDTIEPEKPKVAPAPVRYEVFNLITSKYGSMQKLICPALNSCRPSGSSKALKLGAKGKEVDFFVDKLKSEGENIVTTSAGRKASEASKVLQPPVNMERYCLFPHNMLYAPLI